MMSEVKRRICHVCAGMPREYFCGVCDEGRDYDALAAQRDEGLAREAELQQLLAEAVVLIDRALPVIGDPYYSWMADAGVFVATHGPGCADGEKS